MRSPSTHSTAPAASAFTLVEVLVVIAVVGLLLGLLAPALAAAREAGRSVVCASNLRQWGAAVNSYAADNKGLLPRRGQGVNPTTNITREADWFNALPPHLGEPRYMDLAGATEVPVPVSSRVHRPGSRSVWMCPSAVETDTDQYFAYGMNMRLSVWDVPDPDRIDSVAPPHLQVFLSEGPGPQCSLLPWARPSSPVARHRSNVNICFLDAHAVSFSGSSVGCNVGDPQRADVCWIVPGSPWNPSP